VANFDTIQIQTDFWYYSSFRGVTWPSNLAYFTVGKRILPLTSSRPAVQHGASWLLLILMKLVYWDT